MGMTRAGKALLDDLVQPDGLNDHERDCEECAAVRHDEARLYIPSILAIEAEALAAERARLRLAVEGLPGGCHSHSGLRCEPDWFDGNCGLIDGHAVLALLEPDA